MNIFGQVHVMSNELIFNVLDDLMDISWIDKIKNKFLGSFRVLEKLDIIQKIELIRNTIRTVEEKKARDAANKHNLRR